jgi:hypothetical protein
MVYLLLLALIASNSSHAVIQVDAALSQVYEEPLHVAMSFAHCALQVAPSAVVGLKLLPAAQPPRKMQKTNAMFENFTLLPFIFIKIRTRHILVHIVT